MVFKVNDREYELKFTTKAIVNCEKRLGFNPFEVFSGVADEEGNLIKLPKFTDVLIILHECLNIKNTGMTLDKVYSLFDQYCQEGGNIVTLSELLVQCMQESGLLGNGEPQEAGE